MVHFQTRSGLFTALRRRAAWSVVLCLSLSPALAEDQVHRDPVVAEALKWAETQTLSPQALHTDVTQATLDPITAYRDARLAYAKAVDDQYAVYADLQRLSDLTDLEIAQDFPNGEYILTLTTTAINYGYLRREAQVAQDAARASLTHLTDGRKLTDRDIMELHRLLGL